MLAALLLPACSGKGGAGSGSDGTTGRGTVLSLASIDLPAASHRTLDTKSGRFEVRVTAAVTGLPGRGVEVGPLGTLPAALDLTYTGEGAYDVARARSSLRIGLGSLLGSVVGGFGGEGTDGADGGEGEGESRSLNDRLRTFAGDRNIEIVHDGLAAYYRVPLVSALTRREGETWVKLDLGTVKGKAQELGVPVDDAVGKAAGLLGGGVPLPSADPSSVLGLLLGVGAEVERVGEVQVRGVDTVHVRASASVRRALDAQASDDARARVRGVVAMVPGGADLLDGAAGATLPVDVFVDADGFVRRVVVRYDVGSEAGDDGPRGTLSATYDYYDFGEEIEVDVPEGDQVVDLLDLGEFVESLRDEDGSVVTSASTPR